MSRFTCRSTARALLTIAADYAVIVGAIAISALRDKGWPDTGWGTTALAVVVIGTRQYALGEALLHEASHCHLSRSKRLNDLMGAILAWPVFTSLAAYRRFHNRLHHEVDIADEKNSIWEDYESWGLPPPSRKLSPALAFWLFVLRPAVGLTGVMHLAQDGAGFRLRLRPQGDTPDARCLGRGHSLRSLLLSLARVDPLLAHPLHLRLFDPQLLVRSWRSLQGEWGKDAFGFELVR